MCDPRVGGQRVETAPVWNAGTLGFGQGFVDLQLGAWCGTRHKRLRPCGERSGRYRGRRPTQRGQARTKNERRGPRSPRVRGAPGHRPGRNKKSRSPIRSDTSHTNQRQGAGSEGRSCRADLIERKPIRSSGDTDGKKALQLKLFLLKRNITKCRPRGPSATCRIAKRDFFVHLSETTSPSWYVVGVRICLIRFSFRDEQARLLLSRGLWSDQPTAGCQL